MTCTGCGVTAPDDASTWTAEYSERGVTWLCQRCTRDNLRSIEGRLDVQWWESSGQQG